MILKNIIPSSTWAAIQEYITNIVLSPNNYIEIYDAAGNSVTSFSDNAYKKLATQTAISHSSGALAQSGNNSVSYSGSAAIKVSVSALINVTGTPDEVISYTIYRNGNTEVASVGSLIKIDTNGNTPPIQVQCICSLSQNDYLEVWVKNVSGSSDITLISYDLIVTELPSNY